MRFAAVSALATLAIGQAAAASISHGHAAMHRRMQEQAEFEKRATQFVHAKDVGKLSKLGVAGTGVNDCEDNGHVWIGKNGQYTNEFINHSGEDIILVIWGAEGSWINAQQPVITLSMPPGHKKTISFADAASGAWAAVYSDTELINGQVANTWGEFTFGEWGVVDVSREVNMEGHHMRIHGPQCVTDMETCVFVCPNGMKSCWLEYELHNCDAGSQPGAQFGYDYGAPSGGCGGMGSSAHLRTVFGK